MLQILARLLWFYGIESQFALFFCFVVCKLTGQGIRGVPPPPPRQGLEPAPIRQLNFWKELHQGCGSRSGKFEEKKQKKCKENGRKL